MAEATVRYQTEIEAAAPVKKATRVDECAMVIFGGTGDLARRKLIPALYNLEREGRLPKGFAVIGLSRGAQSPEEFRALHREATAQFSHVKPLDSAVWERLAARIFPLAGDLNNPRTYDQLREVLQEVDRTCGALGNRLYYFATPSSEFPAILRRLAAAGLVHREGSRPWSRAVIEKPFGRDLQSAQELNRLAAELLGESQVFRIDHYLGKETVRNIIVLRFANAIFEPLWNSKYIDHVQITAAEEIGIEGRGRFYEETGLLRDMVQNHLLQILALCAMEIPPTFQSEDIRDERSRVLRALRPMSTDEVPQNVVRAQYRGYREEPGVDPRSRTPTYTALRLYIDNWRWQGVPFYIRAGKRLARRWTEVAVFFQPIPHCLFGEKDVCQLIQPNVLVLRIQPDEGISLCIACKVPGDDFTIGNVGMDFSYAGGFEKPPQEAYERLLLDCMKGDQTLFARQDAVELSWKFVTPILEAWEAERDGPIPIYEPGTEGPREADELLRRDHRRWRKIGEAR
jgi:glucose-6-phosphate 1-dehydrogenase